MRNRRNVFDVGDLESAAVQGTHGGLAAGAWPHDSHFDILDAMLLRRGTGSLCGNLRRERRGLARTTEAAAAGGRPRQRVALPIGDRDDGVVERRVHVRDRIQHVLAHLLADRFAALVRTLTCVRFLVCHECSLVKPCPAARSSSRPACAGLYGCARWYACAGRAAASPCGGGCRDSSPDPSDA